MLADEELAAPTRRRSRGPATPHPRQARDPAPPEPSAPPLPTFFLALPPDLLTGSLSFLADLPASFFFLSSLGGCERVRRMGGERRGAGSRPRAPRRGPRAAHGAASASRGAQPSSPPTPRPGPAHHAAAAARCRRERKSRAWGWGGPRGAARHCRGGRGRDGRSGPRGAALWPSSASTW